MADLEFSFNQQELEGLIKAFPAHKVVVSIGSFKEGNPPKSEMYFFAQVYDANNVLNKAARPITACPNPPGWLIEEGLINVSHEQLEFAPKFEFEAAALTALLPQNDFDQGNGREICVALTVTIKPGALDLLMQFHAKDKAGAAVKTSLAGAAF
jgi:hypothetical protein